MPTVSAQGKVVDCESGANLRQVLLAHGIDLYNDQAKVINCHGLGTCGTCAVQIEGEVSDRDQFCPWKPVWYLPQGSSSSNPGAKAGRASDP